MEHPPPPAKKKKDLTSHIFVMLTHRTQNPLSKYFRMQLHKINC